MNLRGLFPYVRFTLATPWTPEAVERELTKHVDPGSVLTRRGQGSKAWIGRVERGSFKVVRRVATSLRAKNLPIVHGLVRAAPHGSEVEIRIRLVLVAHVFVVAWMILSAVAAVACAVQALGSGRLQGLFALAIPIVGGCFIQVGFEPEARIAEDFLRRLIPPHQPPSAGPFR